MDFEQVFADTDIYLIDQVLKGRYTDYHSVVDVGCGHGRNLDYFLLKGWEVYGMDPNPEAIAASQSRATTLIPDYPVERFAVGTAEANSFADRQFDLVIMNAVLHFARDEAHFHAMLEGAWALLKPGGQFFARLASDMGIEQAVQPLGNRRFLLPDGSERFLVNQAMLVQAAHNLGAQFSELIKTTNVQGLRCMTTWVLKKPVSTAQ